MTRWLKAIAALALALLVVGPSHADRDGTGNYSVPNTFTAGTTITAAGHNQNWADVAAEMTNSLPRDGQAGMTGQFKAATGSTSAPGISFTSDTNTGFYRSAEDTITFTAGGVDILTFSASGLTGAGDIVSTQGTTVFTANGTFTADTNMSFAKVTCVGAGGDGGDATCSDTECTASGGGGEGGGVAVRWYNSTEMGATAAVVIGVGGSGDGTDSTWNPAGTGLTITAGGGDEGTTASTASYDVEEGGSGEGNGTNGQLNHSGEDGGIGQAQDNGTSFHSGSGGQGGSSAFGGGGSPGNQNNASGAAAGSGGKDYGGGGGGGFINNTASTAAGGDGEAGMCLVEEYISSN